MLISHTESFDKRLMRGNILVLVLHWSSRMVREDEVVFDFRTIGPLEKLCLSTNSMCTCGVWSESKIKQPHSPASVRYCTARQRYSLYRDYRDYYSAASWAARGRRLVHRGLGMQIQVSMSGSVPPGAATVRYSSPLLRLQDRATRVRLLHLQGSLSHHRLK